MTSDSIEPHTVVGPSAHVHAEFLDDQAVLYDVSNARPVLLNVSASAVWAALDGTTSVEHIAALLATRFGADPDTVLRDVTAAVRSFDELGLVIVVPRAPA